MAKTKTKIYPAEDEDSMNIMLELVQNTMKEMGMQIKTQFLDKSLIEVQGIDVEGKKNLTTLYLEGNQLYVKFKTQRDDIETFWFNLDKNISVYGQSTEGIEKKAKIVSKILKAVKDMGYTMDEEDCWEFILNFEKNYNRLPNEEEIGSIALSYVNTISDEQEISTGNNLGAESIFVLEDEGEAGGASGSIEEDDEEIIVTPTEALKEMVKEIETLTEEDKRFYLSLFDDLTLDEQKKLVTRIKAIESDLSRIPYLTLEERAKLRKEVMNLSTEKRRAKILKIINKRKKNIRYYEHRALEGKIKSILDKFEFLSDLEKDVYLSLMEPMNPEEKKRFLKKIKNIEDDFKRYEEKGIKFTDIEKKNYRDEFLRISTDERRKRLDEILEEKRYNVAKEELLEEIPALTFEDNDKLIRELMWLDKDERKEKIERIKNKINEDVEKKAKLFEESKVGTTCPKCGWPIGPFTKKCPRCGTRIGFHL
ncbi:MAG: hypothetical protein ACTSVC_01475 [Promethearchaeota archaeon]